MIRLAFERNGKVVRKIKKTYTHLITQFVKPNNEKEVIKFKESVNVFLSSLAEVTNGDAEVCDIKFTSSSSLGRICQSALIIYELEENVIIEEKKLQKHSSI